MLTIGPSSTTDSRTDIYALGLILNELFTGEVPHGVGYKTVASVMADYAWVDDIVIDMIQQDPNKRPASIDAIKSQFVSRKQDFVTRQRLSQIRNAVVPIGEEDGPLATDHPNVLDFEWENGQLALILSRPVNEQWVQAFWHMHYRTSLLGKEPVNFRITGNRAVVLAREHEVQSVIDYFKSWMPIATDAYRDIRARERRERADRERTRLLAEQEELERRRRLRENVRL